MKIKSLHIENWRSIKQLDVELTALAALIGKNNNGKSNILSAILFFFGEINKVSDLDFNEKDKNIIVEIIFNDLDEWDKQQFKKYVTPTAELAVRKLVTIELLIEYRGYIETPEDERLREENLGNYGSREKATALPFYELLPAGRLSKDIIRPYLEEYISSNKANLVFQRRLETTQFMGVKTIAQGMFGEILHIPPVSSAPDELNTKGNTAFNKLYQKLADKVTTISPAYQEAQRAMKALVKSLNRANEDGSDNTDRPIGLTRLESVVAEYLQSWQTSLHVEFDLGNVDEVIKLNTSVWVDDGTKTDISRKGNGLQRSLIFALIKSWARILKDEHAQQAERDEAEGSSFRRGASNSHFFIFEEPELFLHPHAQRELFDSLKELSGDSNQVFLTTHSSSFLRLEDYKSIVSVCKNNLTEGTTVVQCNEELFAGLDEKKIFDLNQWLCPTRGEIFFANRVILVEGRTEEAVIPFLAKKLGVYKYNYSIIPCDGKGNMSSYIKILNSFKIKYIVVYDKDLHPEKDANAIETAIKASAIVESVIDNSLGYSIGFDNDMEDELGIINKKLGGKPHVALQHVAGNTFVLAEPMKRSILQMYSDTTPDSISLSVDEPGADAVIDTLSIGIN